MMIRNCFTERKDKLARNSIAKLKTVNPKQSNRCIRISLGLLFLLRISQSAYRIMITLRNLRRCFWKGG